MEGIAFTKSLQHCRQKADEGIIRRRVSRIFLNGILHLDDGRELSVLGIQHANPIDILNGEIYILEDICLLATGAKCLDTGKHSQEEKDNTNYDYYYYHLSLLNALLK